MYSWYRSTIWSPGLGVEFKTFCDKSVASPLAFILGRCLSTLPVEQEILPSENYGAASLVEVVLCTWAGRRQLSTPTLTYLLRGRLEKQIWPKVRHCLTRPRPPPPPSKVRHIFKKYFYCLFELYSLCLLFGDELVFLQTPP